MIEKRPRKPPEEKLKVRVVHRPPKLSEPGPKLVPGPPVIKGPEIKGPEIEGPKIKGPEFKPMKPKPAGVRKVLPLQKILAVVIPAAIIVPTVVFVIYPNFLAGPQEEQVVPAVRIESATFVPTEHHPAEEIAPGVIIPEHYEGFFEVSGTATLREWELVQVTLHYPPTIDNDYEFFDNVQSPDWYQFTYCEVQRRANQPATGSWSARHEFNRSGWSYWLPGEYTIIAEVQYGGERTARDSVIVTVP